MATEALGQATAAEDRRAQYGELALAVLRPAGAALGRVFGVEEVTPRAIPQVSVSKFMRNHVMSKRFVALGESWPQNHAPTSDARSFRSGHEYR